MWRVEKEKGEGEGEGREGEGEGRKVDTQAILHKLFAIYQPGGNADRGNLLRSLTEVKCGHSIQDTLSAIRMWRRWLCRAEELHIGIPDSMVLIQALSKIAENLTKHAGSQVGFRIAAARQELEVDRRPTLQSSYKRRRRIWRSRR